MTIRSCISQHMIIQEDSRSDIKSNKPEFKQKETDYIKKSKNFHYTRGITSERATPGESIPAA